MSVHCKCLYSHIKIDFSPLTKIVWEKNDQDDKKASWIITIDQTFCHGSSTFKIQKILSCHPVYWMRLDVCIGEGYLCVTDVHFILYFSFTVV